MTRIINLTQHAATPEQVAAGVVEPTAEQKAEIQRLLTFTELPTKDEIYERANALVKFTMGFKAAMVGGAPYLMPAVVEVLNIYNVEPLFAFSKRVSVEKVNEDGSVTKTQVFKHEGFVTVAL